MRQSLMFLCSFAARDQAFLLEGLAGFYDIVAPEAFDEDSLARLIPDADVALGAAISAPLAAAAERLKLLQTPGAGIDGLDRDALLARGVAVANSHSHAKLVAEHAVAMLLALVKKVALHDRLLRQGDWFAPSGAETDQDFVSDSILGATVGFVGFGHVASHIARMLSGFDVGMMAHIRNAGRKIAAECVALDVLLAEADAVFVAVPLTPATAGMIGRDALNAMKPGAYLVSVARAGVIDEDALLDALARRRIAGAAIDSWEAGQSGADRFAGHDTALLSPHRAGTLRGVSAHLSDVVDNLTAYARTGEIRNRVDLEAGY